jgi:endonuclease/exonuclease/phosphatase family metal-dependent hydrolase
LRKADYSDMEWQILINIDKNRHVITQEDIIPILEDNDFQDSFINANIKPPNVTVWSNRRVDYIYVKNIKIISSAIVKTGLSDHYPIYADMQI